MTRYPYFQSSLADIAYRNDPWSRFCRFWWDLGVAMMVCERGYSMMLLHDEVVFTLKPEVVAPLSVCGLSAWYGLR